MPDADAWAKLALATRGMTEPAVFHEAIWGVQVQQVVQKALKD